MAFTPTAIGELLRRHYPRAQAIIQQMIDAIQFTRTQGVKLTDIDVVNRVIPFRSKIRVEETIDNQKTTVGGGLPTYIPPTEPDGNQVKLYLLLDHVAETYRDHSGFNNNAKLLYENGDPDVDTDGPDLGNGYASRALRLDTSKNISLVIPDDPSLDILTLTTGFSVAFRCRFYSLNGLVSPFRLWSKKEDSNNYCVINGRASGRIEVHIADGGVITHWQTTNPVLSTNVWCTIGVEYTISGPAMEITLNGVVQTIDTLAGSQSTAQDTDLHLAGKDADNFGIYDGTNTKSTADSAALDLTTAYSVGCRFRIRHDNTGETKRWLISKGNFATETAGQNLNYFIYQGTDNKIYAGHETSAGAERQAVSPLKYNDGVWHYAVVTWNGSTVRLYIDGISVASSGATTAPDTNAASLIQGGHTGPIEMFIGDLDDMRVWNIALTGTDVTNLLTDVVQATGLVFEDTYGDAGTGNTGTFNGNMQFVVYARGAQWTATQMLAIHNNKWTTNPNVGSNKVAQTFFTRATTP